MNNKTIQEGDANDCDYFSFNRFNNRCTQPGHHVNV